MASSKEYKDFILDNLHLLDNITCRPMMGEYLLYYNKVLFGGIYDDRLLIKRVESNKKYNMEEVIPYKNAKPMYMIEDIDNGSFINVDKSVQGKPKENKELKDKFKDAKTVKFKEVKPPKVKKSKETALVPVVKK